jgi:DNA modification methylase
MTTSEWKNKLYYGDNLVWLRDHDHFPSGSIDLIYIDPPFNSKADYNLIFSEREGRRKSQAQIQVFDDTWKWERKASTEALAALGAPNGKPELVEFIRWVAGRGERSSKSMAAYLSMMAVRLVELHRVLKPTGSFYVHCDPTAGHYLKVLLDSVFGPSQFRNEVIWRRTGAHGPLRSFGPIHDTILFYTKTGSYFFHVVKRPYMRGHVEHRYKRDSLGRYKFTSGGNVLTGAGATKGQSGLPWRGFDPSAKNRHWAIPKFLAEQMPPEFENLGILSKLDALYEAGLIEIVEGAAWPTPVRYLGSEPGQPLQDIWAYQPYTEGTVHDSVQGIDQDVAWLGTTDPERLGYQTQKPIGLLERIILSSCPENGVVLDTFCGCGTTIAAAHKLNRRWIGIDVTWLAVDLVEKRLRESYGEGIRDTYVVYGKPYDEESARALAEKSKREFELWALSLVGAAPRGRNGGVDGLLSIVESKDKSAKVVAQVKGGKSLAPTIVRDLIGTVEKEKAAIGLLITLEEPTSGMRELAVHAGSYSSPIWGKSYPRIQIRTVGELLKGTGFDLPYGESPVKKATPLKGKGRTARML